MGQSPVIACEIRGEQSSHGKIFLRVFSHWPPLINPPLLHTDVCCAATLATQHIITSLVFIKFKVLYTARHLVAE
jgi:hypothetical protein